MTTTGYPVVVLLCFEKKFHLLFPELLTRDSRNGIKTEYTLIFRVVVKRTNETNQKKGRTQDE